MPGKVLACRGKAVEGHGKEKVCRGKTIGWRGKAIACRGKAEDNRGKVIEGRGKEKEELNFLYNLHTEMKMKGLEAKQVPGKARMMRTVPALWASIIDIGLTIAGQPAGYWSGDLSVANERNPIGAFAMGNHVSGLFVISALWIGIIILLGYYLPERISRVFLLFVLIAHCWGASSWIPREYHFVGALSLFLCTAILYGVIEELAAKYKLIMRI